jgi:uncharacterized membrane protein (UPF0127 family)
MRKLAIALLLAGAISIVVAVVLFARGDDGGSPSAPVASSHPPFLLETKPAVAPFERLTEARVGVGGRCLRVVVADDQAERVQGLRKRRDIGAYDGMLFVFDEPVDTSFTMSTVRVPLEIGFYSSDGSPVSRRHMKPCPHAEAGCPDYHAGAQFVFALETLGGKLPSGALSACN